MTRLVINYEILKLNLDKDIKSFVSQSLQTNDSIYLSKISSLSNNQILQLSKKYKKAIFNLQHLTQVKLNYQLLPSLPHLFYKTRRTPMLSTE